MYDRFLKALDLPLTPTSRVLVALAALLVVVSLFVPLWHMTFVAQQYPEGLDLWIYSHDLIGGDDGNDLTEINVLNHYIGMSELHPSDFSELKWLPLVIGLIIVLTFRSAAIGNLRSLIDVLVLFAYSPELRHARWRLFAGEVLRNRLLSGDAVGGLKRSAGAHITDLFEQTDGFDRINKLLYVDLKSYLVDNILTKVDRMSMAVSLEARVPYLDRDVVKMAFQVPGSLKLVRGETKSILKKVAERYIPRECLYRPKEGFSIPIKQWLKSTLRPLMESSLSPDRLRSQGIFDCKEVSAMMQQHLEGSANHSHVLWTMMVFQAWHREWMEGGK